MSETHWAIDLGTTNTLIARWQGTHAETIQLDGITECEPAWQTPLVPSVIFFEDSNRGYIGKQAIAADEVMRATFAGRLTPMARAFKRTLGRASQQPVAEVGHLPISARILPTSPALRSTIPPSFNPRPGYITDTSIPSASSTFTSVPCDR